jgi:hypothetical protein
MKTEYAGWLNSFQRELGYKKSIVLYGNLNDLYYNHIEDRADQFISYIIKVLKKKGFSRIILWDRFQGIDYTFIRKDEMSALQEIDTVQQSGEDYDLGEGKNCNTNTAPSLQNPEDFFPFAYQILTKKQSIKTAIVLDYSTFLFGNSNSLSEVERNWMIILNKAIRNIEFSTEVNTLKEFNNQLLFLTQNLGLIPPVYYQGTPTISTIHVPKPSRIERKMFIERNWDKFLFKATSKDPSLLKEDFIDATDSFSLTEIQQLIKLSRQNTEELSPENLINLYRFGEKTSPWEELSKSKLSQIKVILQKRVKGQDQAIEKIKKVILRAYT